MDSPIFTVSCFSYTLDGKSGRDDPRWIEGFWGNYSSLQDAKKDIYDDVISTDVKSYKILYENDILTYEDKTTDFAFDGHEVMRFVITYKNDGTPAIESVINIVETYLQKSKKPIVKSAEDEKKERHEATNKRWVTVRDYGKEEHVKCCVKDNLPFAGYSCAVCDTIDMVYNMYFDGYPLDDTKFQETLQKGENQMYDEQAESRLKRDLLEEQTLLDLDKKCYDILNDRWVVVESPVVINEEHGIFTKWTGLIEKN
jgi:hypothetical protein